MKEAIDLLCDTVKVTLGPKGNNIIIDHSNFSPFITNDGVTIAHNIENEDEVINTILELAKEASIKTNEVVGDGTTTTLVILQSIFNEGLKLINSGVSPIILKKELENALEDIINVIKSKSRKPTKKDLINIASISSNDEEIGKIISEAYIKTENKNAITITETNSEITTLDLNKGYSLETLIASPYFFMNKNEIVLKNCKILILNSYINDIEEIGAIISEIIKNKLNLVVFAFDYNDKMINDVISLNMENDTNIYLLKIPEYGFKQRSILKDLVAITKAALLEFDIPSLNNLGEIDEIKINKDTTTISFEVNNDIKTRIIELENELFLVKNELDKEFYNRCLSMFKTCLANINVGASTTTERREKKMRYDDALCAIDTAKDGVIPGSGLILLEISNIIDNKNNGYKILKNSLSTPLIQILINSGLDYNNIIKQIKKEHYKILYNIKTNKFENIKYTTVIDPTSVLINSLKNSCSIASMLLTTSSLIINEYKNNYNKINDFNEL